MALPHTFVSGTKAKSSEVNDNFDYVLEKGVPVGSVASWLKSYTNTPSLPEEWVECNGQTLSDVDSVYNGQTIPDLNGDNRFLRGSSTSGSTGGSETHLHGVNIDSGTPFGSSLDMDPSGAGNDGTNHKHNVSGNTGSTSTLPSYYEVVWIMKVK